MLICDCYPGPRNISRKHEVYGTSSGKTSALLMGSPSPATVALVLLPWCPKTLPFEGVDMGWGNSWVSARVFFRFFFRVIVGLFVGLSHKTLCLLVVSSE